MKINIKTLLYVIDFILHFMAFYSLDFLFNFLDDTNDWPYRPASHGPCSRSGKPYPATTEKRGGSHIVFFMHLYQPTTEALYK